MDQIEGTEAQQRRFAEITAEHKLVPPTPPVIDPCGGGFLPYDSEGSYLERD